MRIRKRMEPRASNAGAAQTIRTVAPREDAPEDAPEEAPEVDAPTFDGPALLKTIKGYKKASVSEEELFAAVMQERIGTLHGTEIGKVFVTRLGAERSAMKKAGRVSHEAAAISALRSMVRDHTMNGEQAREVRHQSFHASQLDLNYLKLYDDNRGKDNTYAAEKVSTAYKLASAYFADQVGESARRVRV